MRARPRAQYRCLLCPALISLLTLHCEVVAAESGAAQTPSEYQVKAAFLLNFTKFVEWPPPALSDPSAPLTICILGDDPFGPVLDQMVEGESVNGHKLAVKRIHAMASTGCEVLYVSASGADASQALSELGPGVLTVGDGSAFVSQGGIIGFVLDHHRVRFDINQRAAAKGSLRLSSKLLSVARSVSN